MGSASNGACSEQCTTWEYMVIEHAVLRFLIEFVDVNCLVDYLSQEMAKEQELPSVMAQEWR